MKETEPILVILPLPGKGTWLIRRNFPPPYAMEVVSATNQCICSSACPLSLKIPSVSMSERLSQLPVFLNNNGF